MSDTQFSLLSNSSIDLEVENCYIEEDDMYDQETLSITSNKSVANLEDFDDMYRYKDSADPFLSVFIKEENDDLSRPTYWMENSIDSSDINVFFNSMNTENDLDDYLSGATDVIDSGESYFDLESMSPPITVSAQRSIFTPSSTKRAFSPIENKEYSEVPLPTKQRRVEVSSHVRCDEWINKYHELPEKNSLKASGMLDRRKTKHHKVLSEYDTELQIENIDLKRHMFSIHVQNRNLLSQNTSDKFSSPQTNHIPISLSSYSAKIPMIRTIANPIRKPFINCNINNCDSIKTDTPHITHQSETNSSKTHIAITHCPSVDLSTSGSISSTSGSSRLPSDLAEMPQIPAPLRMGKRVSRRGHRLSLWQFLMCLLDSSRYREHSTGIKWLSRSNGVFHIIDSKQVATLWGQYKERREKMTYDSLARSLRHYYKKNLMAKINNRRLVYQIAQECVQWSLETFLKRNRE